METTGNTVTTVILAILVVTGAVGCTKCWNCDEMPEDVEHIIGEWEWEYSRRGSISGSGQSQITYDDTIYARDYDIDVVVQITQDGCLSYQVGQAENHACLDVFGRTLTEEPYLWWDCRERVQVLITGGRIDADARLLALGYDCETMNVLTGTRIPFESDPCLEPPALESYKTLLGYSNYFKRKQ